jgi:hypothetical protein
VPCPSLWMNEQVCFIVGQPARVRSRVIRKEARLETGCAAAGYPNRLSLHTKVGPLYGTAAGQREAAMT